MRAQVVQQYDFQTEILPPVLVGLLLDIVGRFLGGELSRLNIPFADQIFLDMSGTLYAAVMVGPWWAAVVGIAANAINGNFNDNYFPYGVVNVFGGLAWGYLALAMNLRGQLAEHRPSLRTFMSSYAALVLVGALVCGLASSLTHLVLLPSMKLPLARGGIYDDVREWLSAATAGGPGDVAILLIGDLIRDFLDKLVIVAIGLTAVCLTTTTPSAAKAANWRERGKTDVLSVLSFTILYGVYLFVARIFQPQISFVIFGQRGEVISWLQSAPVIALLYLPIGVALIAFLLFSYDGDSPYGSTVDAHRRARKSLLRQMLPSLTLLETDIALRFTQGRRLLGLYAGIAAWPLEKFYGSPGVTRGPVAPSNMLFDVMFLGGAVAVAGYYFYQNDRLVRGYGAAHRRLAALEEWMNLERATTPRRVAGEIIDMIAARLRGANSDLLQSGPLAYKLVLPRTAEGEHHAEKAPTVGVGVVALVSDGKIIDEVVRKEFERLLDATAPDTAFLLSLNPTEARQIEWLKSLRGRHSVVGLLSWYDVARMIEHMGRGTGADILTSARMRTLELISGGKPMDSSINNVEVQALAARTLPALAYVIDCLPRGSTIYDLGCGRGRHTIYALRQGHRVIAVDRHDGAVADLRRFVNRLGALAANAMVLSGDYSEISRDTYGSADLVIAAGIMQYVTSLDELQRRLDAMSALITEPNAKIFIEMLFDMTYDGKPATDGRCNVTRAQFEEVMRRTFPTETWSIQLVNGPRSQVQDFSTGPRSFYPLGRIIESTCVEYLLIRLH